jgi:hypothetical protein
VPAELKSLRRAHRLLHLQKWLLGLGIGFVACSRGHFLLVDHPLSYGICMALGLACWIGHFMIRRRLSATAP